MAENEPKTGWLSRAKKTAKDLLGVSDDSPVGQNEIMAADGAYSYGIAEWWAEYY